MAQVTKKSRAGKTDPFGTGKILVSDCLDGFSNEELETVYDMFQEYTFMSEGRARTALAVTFQDFSS